MAKQRGDSEENQEKRLRTLEKILEKYEQEGKKPTNKELLSALKKEGFTISYRTLLRDLADAATNNEFVQNLASKTYSKIMEDCFNSMEFVEEQARLILETKWTKSSIIKKTLEDGTTETTITTTREIAEPKLKALQIISENADRKSKMINGESIMTSAASWISQRKHDMQIINEQQNKIKDLEVKLGTKKSH